MASTMTTRSRTWPGGFTAALLLGVILGCTGIREDELACEEAVAHLQDCCPGFYASSVDCTYEPGGCGVSPLYPEISTNQGWCIRSESCAELESTGVCARAIAMPPATTWSDTNTDPSEGDAAPPPFPQVCP
jgi:hypothetical protein